MFSGGFSIASKVNCGETKGMEIIKKPINLDGYRVDGEKVKKLVDPELRFRHLRGWAARIVLILCIILSLFHIYTAGFGVLQEWKHRCFHFSFVLSLIFLIYPTRKVPIRRLWLTWVYEIIFSVMGTLRVG